MPRLPAVLLLLATCGAPAIPAAAPPPPPKPPETAPPETAQAGTAPPGTVQAGTAPPVATADLAPAPVPVEVPTVHIVLTRSVAAGKARVVVKGAWSLFGADGTPVCSGSSLDGDLVLTPALTTLGGTEIPAAGGELWTHADSDLRVDGRSYPGTLVIARGPGGRLRPVISTDLETYVATVVNSEIPATFHREAQRVQAIIARTYALASTVRLLPSDPLVLTDVGGSDQEFAGISPMAEHRRVAAEAASSTRGLVLMDGTYPLAAYYHSSCGGVTCPGAVVFGKRGATVPLSGGVECAGCASNNKYYRWDATIPAAKVLAATGLSGVLESVAVIERTAGGRAVTLDITAGGKSRRLRAAEFRLAVGASNLRSTLLETYCIEEGQLVVRGRGWGHGVGLCQMGAKTMAEGGANAETIVARYYPGAKVQQLW